MHPWLAKESKLLTYVDILFSSFWIRKILRLAKVSKVHTYQLADDYIITKNATESYKKIYKCKDDNVSAAAGTRLLRNVKIQQYIEKKLKKQFDKYEITQERILREYAKIAFFNLQNN